jgi:hypothetical protein
VENEDRARCRPLYKGAPPRQACQSRADLTAEEWDAVRRRLAEKELRPLFALFAQAMHGPFRIPTLLRRVEQPCRQAGETSSDIREAQVYESFLASGSFRYADPKVSRVSLGSIARGLYI